MASKVMHFFFLFLVQTLYKSAFGSSENWVQAGYWYTGSEIPVADINSKLFTHIIYAFVDVNSSTYQLSYASSDHLKYLPSFTDTLKKKNPSIRTLLSVWAGQNPTGLSILGEIPNSTVLSSMVGQASNRKSFIESSIATARNYGFHGIDLFWVWPSTGSDLKNMGSFLDEWREAIDSETRGSNESKLVISMAVHYFPAIDSVDYPVDSLKRNLDWANVIAYDYYLPTQVNATHAHAALYDPSSHVNTDYGIREWIKRGLPANKLVLGMPYHGYAWTLVNSGENRIGAAATGPAMTQDGAMGYKLIKSYVPTYSPAKSELVYNDTYVVNYVGIGPTWIGYDGVETIRAKVSYARERGLQGYHVFQLSNDDNWELSEAAYGKSKDGKWKLLVAVLVPSMVILVLLFLAVYRLRMMRARAIKSRDVIDLRGKSLSKDETEEFAVQFDPHAPNLLVFNLEIIKAATNNFSTENKLGEGGFGPVYKGKLSTGQDIAVKRLSKTSVQGLEEFKNELVLTGKLQHVNLLRVLGYCSEKEEKMLIYDFMPNSSLDFYLFDPIKKYMLDWDKRVRIIEGITQGLLYLQEYSNYVIVHRDLKSSNVLLDDEMNPKISDFGIARVFKKDQLEANTGRIVGTYGYVPPEYVKKGIYSRKYDVYSYGVLLLQIISGKRNTCCHGLDKNLSLLEYAYDLWREDRIADFIDLSLDDSCSYFKLSKCMQIGLLCVQENPLDRLSMLEISSLLKNETEPISTPKKPAFSVNKDEIGAESTVWQEETWSVNTMSLSQMFPR